MFSIRWAAFDCSQVCVHDITSIKCILTETCNSLLVLQVPSDQNIAFNEKPMMKCHEITEFGVKALKSGKYRHVRVNFPNPDMVGHTGDLEATIVACTAVDKCIKVRVSRRACFWAEVTQGDLLGEVLALQVWQGCKMLL